MISINYRKGYEIRKILNKYLDNSLTHEEAKAEIIRLRDKRMSRKTALEKYGDSFVCVCIDNIYNEIHVDYQKGLTKEELKNIRKNKELYKNREIWFY